MNRLIVLLDSAEVLFESNPRRAEEGEFEILPRRYLVRSLVKLVRERNCLFYLINRKSKNSRHYSGDITLETEALIRLLYSEGVSLKVVTAPINFSASRKEVELSDLILNSRERVYLVTEDEDSPYINVFSAIALDTAISGAAYYSQNWGDICEFIVRDAPSTVIERKTAETAIRCTLRPWGNGHSSIVTGIGFFDHMLNQSAFYAKIDIVLAAKGDLIVDEHHTIEDCAIVIGEALSRSLDNRRGLMRFGFYAPLDEALSHVVLDLSGRAELVWDVVFKREKIGDMPTEMIKHFFKSLAAAARMTLHISAKGENEHHLAESIFKAFGHALRDALGFDDRGIVPSTKGVI